jgi:SAM-dependent methyltransferase
MPTLLRLTEENIESFVNSVNSKISNGDISWGKYANSIKFEADIIDAEPESDEFMQFQMSLWSTVTGKTKYKPLTDEANNNLDGVLSIVDFYPFVSKNTHEVGNYFTGVSNIFRNLGVNPPGKIVEFGMGWGHTTRMLASMGFDVTAVDIEKRFLNLLAPFSIQGSNPIEDICSSFTDYQAPDESVDAVVFFEWFHHCLEFHELIQNIKKMLKRGGRILFCAEAFYDEWFDYPWGLRLDGHSIWAIRNFGWMELGFRKSYIAKILDEVGFDIEWSSIGAAHSYGEMLVAIKRWDR